MNATNKALPPPKKRSFDSMINNSKEEDKEEHFTEEEMAAMSRSERKRHREKKRRSDVNKGFDELMALLLEIDPDVREEAEDRASKGQCKRSLGAHEDNVLSRVDLIATSIKVLKRVHGENEKHKQMIEELLQGSSPKTASVTSAARPAVNSGAFKPSFLERASLLQERAALLQKSAALGVSAGAPSAHSAWESAQQLRAAQQASIYGSSATAAAPHKFGGYSTSDLLAMRAAASSGRVSTTSAASDANLLAHLTQRNQFLQSVLQGSKTSATPAPSTMTEALYGALGPGQMPTRKENDFSAEAELRRLREQRLG